MPGPTEIRTSPRRQSAAAPRRAREAVSQGPAESAPLCETRESPVRLIAGAVGDFKEGRRRRRVPVAPMYSAASLRMLGQRGDPMEGHVLDLSESGMAIQVDRQIAVGQPVTVEFSLAGLGRQRHEGWPTYAIAAEVVRIDGLADFPAGPYRTALRFVRIATMVQAQIARYVVMQPVKTPQ